jgi:hypothetical protein
MQLSDADIREVVATGEYSDKEAENWLAECLIRRRDIVGRKYFNQVLPLGNFRVTAGRLEFDDLALQYNFIGKREFQVSWARFDNQSGTKSDLPSANTLELPQAARDAAISTYWAATMKGDDAAKTVTIFLRRIADGHQVVGVERTW